MSRIPNIDDTLPETQAAFDELSRLAAAERIRIALNEYGAVRTDRDTTDILQFRDQDYAAYLKRLPAGATPVPKAEWRPITTADNSYHNKGGAFDFHVVSQPAGMTADQAHARVIALAPKAGLKSGVSFGDPKHMQLNLPLGTVGQMWDEYQATRPHGPPPIVTAIVAAIGLGMLGAFVLRRYVGA